MATTEIIQSSETAASRRLLEMLVEGYHPRDFAVRFWDGSVWESETPEARFTLVLKHPGTVRSMFDPRNACSYAEAFIYDDFDVEGDILGLPALTWHMNDVSSKWGLARKLQFLWKRYRLPSEKRIRVGRQGADLSGEEHSVERDRQAVTYHYDLPASAFALFLDQNMQYSCGYFKTPDNDLDTCQRNKLEHICRKLRLKPGERFADFGCGWGTLIIYAAKHFGVEAVGVTVSGEQADRAEQLIRENGLEGRCRIVRGDYREFPEDVLFDKAASVGFAEHVGERMIPGYFAKVWRLLRPNGLYLHHVITMKPHIEFQPRRAAFVRKYVFPDGGLQPQTETQSVAEKVGFEVRDVESLREHYTRTLAHWVRNLEAKHDEFVSLVDEASYRVFRMYMAGAIQGFQTGRLNLYQTVYSKPDGGESQLPLTRADLYASL